MRNLAHFKIITFETYANSFGSEIIIDTYSKNSPFVLCLSCDVTNITNIVHSKIYGCLVTTMFFACKMSKGIQGVHDIDIFYWKFFTILYFEELQLYHLLLVNILKVFHAEFKRLDNLPFQHIQLHITLNKVNCIIIFNDLQSFLSHVTNVKSFKTKLLSLSPTLSWK